MPGTVRGTIWPVAAYSLLAIFAVARHGLRRREPAVDWPVEPESRIGGARSSVAQSRRRAGEPGRGRQAESPWQIPWTGWKDIALRTWNEVNEDRLLAIAAGVVFYGLLALFPAIAAFVSLYGLFGDTATISQHLSILEGVLPAGGFDLVRNEVGRIVGKGDTSLGLFSLFGLLVAIWSANAGMKAIIDALNVVYEEDEKRGFFMLNLVSLAMTLGALAVLLLAVGAFVVLPLILSFLELGGATEIILRLARWPLLFILVVVGLALLYRYGPSREEARWQWLSVGSVVAAVAWLIGSALLSWYLANFADYDATYGSLGAAVGLMMWMWLSSIAVLLGAELNSEVEHQTARDSTTGPKRPLGRRGATMADTIGPAQAD